LSVFARKSTFICESTSFSATQGRLMSMKIEVSEYDLELLVKAVDQYYAYTSAVQRTDDSYRALRDKLRQQGQKHFEPPKVPKHRFNRGLRRR
jgi:hypothetical protein